VPNRMSHWKKPRFLMTFLSGDDEKRLDKVTKLQAESLDKKKKDQTSNTQGDLIAACRELIFDVSKEGPVFHAILYGIDTDIMSLKIEHMIDILIEPNQSEDEIDEEVRNTLAIASAYDIPVYPNSEKVAPLLAKYHRKVLIDGFTAPDHSGKRIKLKLKRSPGERINDAKFINELNPTQMVSPADLLLIREAVAAEMARLSNAKSILVGIESGIAELESLLADSNRNENAIQRCLTENPFLFGPEYVQVKPKHKLGSEYEMDYALVKYSGLVDLVEIESSALPLFNKKGDPTSYMVHAEQQVMDWLHWIETNNPYARRSLPGLSNPIGYVVIGRSSSLSEKGMEKLLKRNSMFQPRMLILTYDDLIERAKQLLRVLEGVKTER